MRERQIESTQELTGVMAPKLVVPQRPLMGTGIVAESPLIGSPVSDGVMVPDLGRRAGTEGKGLRTRVRNASNALILTAASLAGTEGAAHIGGAALAPLPAPSFMHDSRMLAGSVAASYIPFAVSQFRTNREAGKLSDEGKQTFNVFATGLRNAVRRRFSDNTRLENAAVQVGGALPQVALEGYYWLGPTALTTVLTDVQHGAFFMIGANLGAAAWNNIQTDAAQVIREKGLDMKGFGKVREIPTIFKGVARIKVDRNVTRLRNMRSKIGNLEKEGQQPELVAVAVNTDPITVFDNNAGGTSATSLQQK